MLERIGRPSPPLVISLLALFVAISGVAGALPGKNTVDSGDVKKNTLKGKDIKESTLKIPAKAVAGSGLKDSCPAGMTRFGNTVCIDTVPRGTGTVGTAIVTCSNANLRLPSVAEAYMAFHGGLIAPTEAFWIDTLSRRAGGSGGVDSAVDLFGSGTYFGVDGTGSDDSIRCATVPGEN